MKETIQTHIAFSDESFDLLLSIDTEREAKKNQVLFQPNKPTEKILFLKKELLVPVRRLWQYSIRKMPDLHFNQLLKLEFPQNPVLVIPHY